jgi:hypothetical protein
MEQPVVVAPARILLIACPEMIDARGLAITRSGAIDVAASVLRAGIFGSGLGGYFLQRG